jgi:hypothetical protein
MEAAYSSETLDDFEQTILRCIPENRTLHNHRYEKPISYNVQTCLFAVATTKYVNVP